MAQDKKQVEQITDMEVDFAKWFTDVCKKAELHIRLGNWVMRPLLASATAAALTRLLLYRLYRTPAAQILVLAFAVGVFLFLYTSFLQLLGTDFWSYTQNTLLKKGEK